MVRMLARFGLSRPCSTPLLVVAHSRIHAVLLLGGIHKVFTVSVHFPSDIRFTVAQKEACRQLGLQLVNSAPQELIDALNMNAPELCLSANLQGIAEARVQSAAPELQSAFPSLAAFHGMMDYDSRYNR